MPLDFDQELLSLVTPVSQIITPSVNPGECWPFPGDRGNVTIALARPVAITNVTLEHIPGSQSVKPSTAAPREFQVSRILFLSLTFKVFGLNDIKGGFTEPVLLLSETFELNANDKTTTPSIKTFSITPVDAQTYSHVLLRVLSNYGATYTCIYRFRVHSVV